MITIIEALKSTASFLEKKGIEDARLNADLLLTKVLNCQRIDLYKQFDKPLTEDEINGYRNLIKRRENFEPLQYILGEVTFYGLRLKVNKDVLIPRPETELLVETVLNNVQNSELSILDIGTGSGNIALGVAKSLDKAKIFAIDNSEKALDIARENCKINSVTNVSFELKDIFKEIEFNSRFDVIVSNPPYVLEESKNKLQKEIVNYEPQSALFVEDEMKFYDRIIYLSRSILKVGGLLFFELGENQAERVKKRMELNSFQRIKIIKDYSRIDRIIFGEKVA